MNLSKILARIDGAIDRHDSQLDPKTRMMPDLSKYEFECLAAALASDLKDIRKMVVENLKPPQVEEINKQQYNASIYFTYSGPPSAEEELAEMIDETLSNLNMSISDVHVEEVNEVEQTPKPVLPSQRKICPTCKGTGQDILCDWPANCDTCQGYGTVRRENSLPERNV